MKNAPTATELCYTNPATGIKGEEFSIINSGTWEHTYITEVVSTGASLDYIINSVNSSEKQVNPS